MGKMKEIFMEIQDQFDGNIPTDFDFDTLIAQKILEMNKTNLSSCCSADMSILISENGPSFDDIKVCPNCHDLCSIKNN
jgi:hypothetical protein